MYIIAAYDIADPRRLRKVAKVMERYGERVQKSVFHLEVSEVKFKELRAKVKKLMDLEEDSVKYYWLCKRCIIGVEVIGQGEYVEVGGRHVVV